MGVKILKMSLCFMCLEKHHKLLKNPLCDHIFCYSCLLEHIENQIICEEYKFNCPISECNSFLDLEFIQINFKNEIKKCSSCLNVKFKKKMKKSECHHKICLQCYELKKKCANCLKKEFTQNIQEKKEILALKDAEEKNEESKRKCRLCKIYTKTEKTIKMQCCTKRLCHQCLEHSFKKQMKIVIKEYGEANFLFHCPKCEQNIEKDDGALLIVLDSDIFRKYQVNFLKRKQCKICKVYKNKKKMIELSFCHHKICRRCLKNYLQTLKINTKVICPYIECEYQIDLKELTNNDKFGQIIKEIQESLQLTNDIIKSLNIFDLKNSEALTKNKTSEKNDKNCLSLTVNNSKLENADKTFNNYKVEKIPQNEEFKEIGTKSNNLKCTICHYHFSIEDMLTLGCDHRFCKDCLLIDWSTKINEGSVSPTLLICPAEKCKISVNFLILEANLPKKLFEKYDQLLMKHSISNKMSQNITNKKLLEKMISCPKCQITYLILKEASTFECANCKIKYCANDKCLREMGDHQHPCEFYKKRKNLSDEQFENFIKENNLKRCPVCQIVVEKIKNCNYIICSSNSCQKKTVFCYLCGSLLKEKDLSEHYLKNTSYSTTCKMMLEKKIMSPIVNVEENEKTLISNQETKNKLVFDVKIANKNTAQEEKCLKCNKSLKNNHLKIIIEDILSFFVCIDLKPDNSTLFCYLCGQPIVIAENIILHFLTHTKDYYNINKISAFIQTFNEKSIMKMSKVTLDKKFDGYFCQHCNKIGKKLNNHKKVLINSKSYPICGEKLLIVLKCQTCSELISFNELEFHRKNIHEI